MIISESNLIPEPSNHSDELLKNVERIKSIDDAELSCRKFSKYLNEKQLLTPRRKKLGVTVNNGSSVLEKYSLRQ